MEDGAISDEISRQGAFEVDSKTNTFVYLGYANMAAIAITAHAVKREILEMWIGIKK
jgi:hypothetical protein